MRPAIEDEAAGDERGCEKLELSFRHCCSDASGVGKREGKRSASIPLINSSRLRRPVACVCPVFLPSDTPRLPPPISEIPAEPIVHSCMLETLRAENEA